MNRYFLSLIFLFSINSCNADSEKIFSNGIDNFFKSDLSQYKDLNVGIVANHTSLNKDSINLAQLAYTYLNLKAIFTPEHGFFGQSEAGEIVNDNTFHEIPIYSLYGKNKKPSKEQLKAIDVLIFDMQDIGSRYYTYVSTLTYVMEAAAENEIKLIILDRPNPLGNIIQGPILDMDFSSFVGIHPVPIRYGLTIGEYALLINGRKWIDTNNKLDLEIIHFTGWDGEFNSFNIAPSPNIPDVETAIIYNGLCLLEGTNISEGRGTDSPFKVFGAPWLNSEEVIASLESSSITGIEIKPISFTPVSIPGKSKYPKFKNQTCNGISVKIVDNSKFHPLRFGVQVLKSIYEVHPNEFEILENDFLNPLYGSDALKNNVLNSSSIDNLEITWNQDSKTFIKVAKPYRIYQ